MHVVRVICRPVKFLLSASMVGYRAAAMRCSVHGDMPWCCAIQYLRVDEGKEPSDSVSLLAACKRKVDSCMHVYVWPGR